MERLMNLIQSLAAKWKNEGTYYQQDSSYRPFSSADFENVADLPLLNSWVEFLVFERPNALIFNFQICPPLYLKSIPNDLTEMAIELANSWISSSSKLSSLEMWMDNRICIATGPSASGLFLDLHPGLTGKRGQIVSYYEGFSYQKVVFDSLEELFSACLAGNDLLVTDFDLVLEG
jgi:hypothetical protein